MDMKNLRPTYKMREWDKRKKNNRKYINAKSTAFIADRKKMWEERKEARKKAYDRYITARYKKEIEEKGKVFDPKIDTRQTMLDGVVEK